MKKKFITNITAAVMQERLDSNLTTTVSAIGPDSVGAMINCLADQDCSFAGVRRFEIIAARRISSSFIVQIEGHEGEAWEVWEFEVFGHWN
jgi:hypothetical protein